MSKILRKCLFVVFIYFFVGIVFTFVGANDGRKHKALDSQTRVIKGQSLQDFWIKFQTAVATDNKQEVANMTFFPFKGHPFKESLSRKEFLGNYEKVFTQNFKTSVKVGKPIMVTKADVRELEEAGLDPCGIAGEYQVVVPDSFYGGTDERLQRNCDGCEHEGTFFRFVIRKVNKRYKLHHVEACS